MIILYKILKNNLLNVMYSWILHLKHETKTYTNWKFLPITHREIRTAESIIEHLYLCIWCEKFFFFSLSHDLPETLPARIDDAKSLDYDQGHHTVLSSFRDKTMEHHTYDIIDAGFKRQQLIVSHRLHRICDFIKLIGYTLFSNWWGYVIYMSYYCFCWLLHLQR